MHAPAFQLMMVSIALLCVPCVVVARCLIRKGDAMAWRRLLFIVPGQLAAGAALLAGIDAMELDDPEDLVITASSLLGVAGALVCLMCHQIARI
ncbi:hypothetical protein ACHMW6_17530 [Pseudoduganella sp. UC29_106]|uniref:hypothetical protein n=1 Tax=Pseudoduganella sp. UC29_106 TaxID=3374553 RepID=UPI0037573401